MTVQYKAIPFISYNKTNGFYIAETTINYISSLLSSSLLILGLSGPNLEDQLVVLKTFLQIPEDFNEIYEINEQSDTNVILLWLWIPETLSLDVNYPSIVVITSGSDMKMLDISEQVQLRHIMLYLLSSTIIYCENGEINNESIDRLQWCMTIPSQVRIKLGHDDTQTAERIYQYAPCFLWLGQQFKQKWLINDHTGIKQSPKEYLKKELVEENGFTDEVMRRNSIRLHFSMCFPEYESLLLSRSQFKDGIQELYQHIHHKFSSKKIDNWILTTDTIIGVVNMYLEAVNNKRLPVIQSAADYLHKESVSQHFNWLCNKYEKLISSEKTKNDGVLVSERNALCQHYKAEDICLCSINSSFEHKNTIDLLQNEDPIFQEAYQAWKSTQETQLKARIKDIKKMSEDQCIEILQEVFPTTLVPFAVDINETTRDEFGDGLLKYLPTFKTTAQSSVVQYRTRITTHVESKLTTENYLGEHASEWLLGLIGMKDTNNKSWCSVVLNTFKTLLLPLREQREIVENKLLQAREQTNEADMLTASGKQKEEYEEKLKSVSNELSQIQIQRSRDIRVKQTEIDRISSEMSMRSKKHELHLQSLQNEIQWTRERTLDIQKRQAELQNEVSTIELQMQQQLREAVQERREDERVNLSHHQELTSRILSLQKTINAKKSKHLTDMFALEKNEQQEMQKLQSAQDEKVQKLIDQTNQEMETLRVIFSKQRKSLQRDIDAVMKEIETVVDNLAELELNPEAYLREKHKKMQEGKALSPNNHQNHSKKGVSKRKLPVSLPFIKTTPKIQP